MINEFLKGAKSPDQSPGYVLGKAIHNQFYGWVT